MTEFQNAAPDTAQSVRCELAAEMLRSSGMLRLRVTGWSMLPTLIQGDLLVFERASANIVSEDER